MLTRVWGWDGCSMHTFTTGRYRKQLLMVFLNSSSEEPENNTSFDTLLIMEWAWTHVLNTMRKWYVLERLELSLRIKRGGVTTSTDWLRRLRVTRNTLHHLRVGDVGGKLMRCEDGNEEPTSFTPRLKEPSDAMSHVAVPSKPERLRVARCGFSTVMYCISMI